MALVLGILFVSVGKNYLHSREINREYSLLENEVKRLEGRNKEISSLLEFFKTDAFAEEEARLKLGLGKPGEAMVVIPESDKVLQEKEEEKNKESSNPKKWWNYFFKIY
jgi:cell division protein FtsB